MWSQMEDAAQLIMKHSSILSHAKEKKSLRACPSYIKTCGSCNYSRKKKLPLRENYTVDRGIRKNMCHFISLSPPPPTVFGAGWFMLEIACLQLILSICVAARSQILQIAKLCATPLCGFPAIRAYLGFLK